MIKPSKQCFIFLLSFYALSFDARGMSLVEEVSLKQENEYLALRLYRNKTQELITWYGTLSDINFDPVEKFLKQVKSNKEIHLYIRYGGGGSVQKHKSFINTLITKKGKKSLTTYLDGRCSSMCTTLFLKGENRIAGDDPLINLGVHRTLVKFFGRRIPVQSTRSMARYFSEFEGVNKAYVMKNRRRFFKQPNNALYKIHSQELLDTGFAKELSHKLERNERAFLQAFFRHP